MLIELLRQLMASRLALLGTLGGVVGLLTAAIVRLIPWGLFVLLIVLAVVGVVAFVYLRQWWAKRKDAAFEAGLDAQGQRAVGHSRVRDRENVKALQTQWKQQVEALRRSRVGRQRRWLYFLPWYVIMGAPASGKTTAIANSGLRFPMGQPKLSGTGGTRNCDWWFSEEAVILDTAGRYAFNEDNEPDRDEWLEFLRLLKKYRPAAPINGLIVAVPADDILGRDPDELTEAARTLRHKLDQLVHELGIHFPIYLLVTKCDLIEGFTEFFGRLPRRRLDEMLGWTNPTLDMADPRKIVHEAIEGLRQRIAAMRPGFLWEEERPEVLRAIYVFPEEMRTFQQNLEEFCDVLFRETQYNESPYLRGLYLTSGLQKGTTVSAMLRRLGMHAQATELREENRSYFLRDFFTTRLAGDRNLVATSGHARGRVRVAHNLSLAVVAAACVLAAVVFGGSYVANRTLLNRLEDAMTAAKGTEARPPAETVHSLGEYVDVIAELEDRDRRRPLSARWGLWTGDKAIVPARTLFLDSFERDAYRPSVEPVRRLVQTRDAQQGFPALEGLIRNYVLSRMLNGTSKKAPGANDVLADFWARGQGIEPTEDLFASYASGYLAYLRWRSADAAQAEQAADLQLLRDALPAMFNVDAVVRWANGLYPAVQAAQLPGMPRAIANDARVDGAFRPEAWEQRIGPLTDAVEDIAPDVDPQLTARFREAYRNRWFGAWHLFLTQPKVGGDGREPIALLLGEQTPYFAIVEQAAGAMDFDAGTGSRPAWAGTVARVGGARGDYLAQLASVDQVVKSGQSNPPAALQDAQQLFARPVPVVAVQAEAPADPFGRAERYVAGMTHEGEVADAEDAAMRDRLQVMLQEPIFAAFRSYLALVGDEIDRRWSLDVAGRPTGDCAEVQSLYAPGGPVDQFLNAVLAPFFEPGSLQPKVRYRARVPRDAGWFPASIARARKRCGGGAGGGGGGDRGKLVFTTIPSDPGVGGVFATRTMLTVWCGDGEPWSIEHRQYPVTKQLTWSKEDCSRAEVVVWVGTGAEEERRLAPRSADSLCELLRAADESRGGIVGWRFPDGVTAKFRVNVPPDMCESTAGLAPPARLPRPS